MSLTSGSLIKILTNHLASSLLEKIQAAVKDEEGKWIKEKWVFPQVHSGEA